MYVTVALWVPQISAPKFKMDPTKVSNSLNFCFTGNGGLPISRVAPLISYFPCHTVVPVDFPNTCPMKTVRIFYRIIARYGRDIYTLTQPFPNQQWYNKSTYDLVERSLFPLPFYRRYIKFKERYSDVSKFRMIFNSIHLSSI